METIHSINLISTNPNVRSGRPCIAGTTIEVSALVIAKIIHQQSAEEIAADYKLSLSQVYAAFAYYYDHKKEIDTTIQQERKLAQEMKEKGIGKRPSPLH